MNSWIPGIDKLVELTASGIGAIAGTFLATWKARKEGQARIVAAEADAKISQIRTDAHAKARELLVSEDSIAGGEIDIADLVSERITYQERKRQTNIRGVVAKAAAVLEHKEVSATKTDHDWAARFFNEVQDVSSEEMQKLWAKVLAGEVERSGSTSIRTLGILRDLDQSTAELFAKFCSACIFLQPGQDQQMIDARVVSLGKNAAANSLQEFGFGFANLNRLNEHGLIISDYNSWRDLSICIAFQGAQGMKHVDLPFRYQGALWALEPHAPRKPDTEFKVHGVALSHAGQELSRIVDQVPVPNYTKRLGAYFQQKKLKMQALESAAVRT